MSGSDELSTLIDLASLGHLPLFHQQWIRDTFGSPRRLSFARATKVVQDGLKRLERHATYDRKQTALGAFTASEREEFIHAFFKMVEYRALDGLKELH